jgi:MFS family permease
MISGIVRANPYGWVVVGVMFLLLGLVVTARSSLGLMIPQWETEFGWDRTFLSSGGAVMLVVMAALAPLAGLLIDRLGSRIVYMVALLVIAVAMAATAAMTEAWQFMWIFCVFAGVGFAAISAPMVATTIALYFEEHRGTATGIATSGATGGVMLLMPALAVGVEAVGWRASFVVMGLTCGGLAVFTRLMIKREDVGHRAGPARSSRLYLDLGAVLSAPAFWLLFAGFVICGFTTVGAIRVHLLPYAAACGFPPIESATAFGVLAVFSMIGMIGYGWLADRYHRPMLLAGIYFLRAFTFILLMYAGADISLLFIFAVLFGIFDFSTFPVVASLVASHLGLRTMGLTMGLLFAGHSLGGAAGSFLGGWLFDLFQLYDWMWIASFAVSLMAAVFSILIRENRDRGTATAEAAPA